MITADYPLGADNDTDAMRVAWVVGKRRGSRVRMYNQITGAWDEWRRADDSNIPDSSPCHGHRARTSQETS